MKDAIQSLVPFTTKVGSLAVFQQFDACFLATMRGDNGSFVFDDDAIQVLEEAGLITDEGEGFYRHTEAGGQMWRTIREGIPSRGEGAREDVTWGGEK